MSLDRIKQALLRKFGPLPAWAWASIGGVGLYLWRRHQAATGTGGLPSAEDVGYPGGADTYGTYPQDFGYYGTGSGGGGGGGTNDQPAAPPPVYYDPATDSYAAVPPDWYTTPPPWYDQPSPDTPTPTTTTTTATGPSTATTPRPHPTGAAVVTQKTKPALTPGGKLVTAPAGTEVVEGTGTGPYLFNELAIEIPPGAYNVKRLGTGAVEYTLPSGAIIEQAPGYPRYRIGTAPGSPAAATAGAVTRPQVAARTTQVVQQSPAPTVTRTSQPSPSPAPASKPAPAPAPTPTPAQKVVIVTSPAKAAPAAQPGKRVIE